MTRSGGEGTHVTDLELAAYIDRGLSAEQRTRIENHLASCDACRSTVVATATARRAQRRSTIARRGTFAFVAAAAVIAAISLQTPDREREERMRNESSSAALIVHGPIGEVSQPAQGEDFRFIWGAEPSALSYRLTLSTSDGATAWTRDGRDTIATLPDSVHLNPGARYFWTVDAILASGRSRSTGLREFVVAP
jgi:hypothetical protein